MAADLTATVRVGAIQFMDDFDSYQSSEGGAAVTAEAVGTAARGIGQIFKEGKNDALACGFNPEAVLQIQGKDMPWAEAVKGLGVWVDKNLNFEKHIAEMRAKAKTALATIATAAELAELRWDDYIRVVPQRVESRALHGQELVIVNDKAQAHLNSMQREWGAAIFGFFPGAPLYTEVAGWKLMVELGWRGRQWHRAVIKAIMAEERAWATDWGTLHDVFELSEKVDGGWLRAVQRLRERYNIPKRQVAPGEESKSKAAMRYRLERYRVEQVEPRVYKEAEEEILKERAKPGNAVYAALHPGRDSVAAALKGNGWGHQTVADYRRWAALRLVLWHPRGCPVCHIMDGSAVHILEAHCAPRLPDSATSGPLGALALLQTSKPPDELRRNIRVVGQTLRGGQNWDWLAQGEGGQSGKEEEQEDDGLAGGLAELVEDARREAGEDWSGDVGAKEGEEKE